VPGNVGGHRQRSNQGIAMSSQPAVGLETLMDLHVRGLCTAPQLDSICPHGLEDTFVKEKLVWKRELGATT